jgi:hypothetical protein
MYKIKMKYASQGIAIALLALTTAIATGYVHMPHMLVGSPYAPVLFVIVSLVAFATYPVVGLALFLMTAVLFFTRNMNTTLFAGQSTYGEDAIPKQYMAKAAAPSESIQSGPRAYDEFAETDQRNPMIGPVHEGFEPAPYGDEQGAPVDGMYPKEEPRASADATVEEYLYRPEPETGSNDFSRFGPDLDQKKAAVAY